ncbi:MAG: hypothetical protein ACO3SO_00940, partial [Luteolibacter sp.]
RMKTGERFGTELGVQAHGVKRQGLMPLLRQRGRFVTFFGYFSQASRGNPEIIVNEGSSLH